MFNKTIPRGGDGAGKTRKGRSGEGRVKRSGAKLPSLVRTPFPFPCMCVSISQKKKKKYIYIYIYIYPMSCYFLNNVTVYTMSNQKNKILKCEMNSVNFQ